MAEPLIHAIAQAEYAAMHVVGSAWSDLETERQRRQILARYQRRFQSSFSFPLLFCGMVEHQPHDRHHQSAIPFIESLRDCNILSLLSERAQTCDGEVASSAALCELVLMWLATDTTADLSSNGFKLAQLIVAAVKNDSLSLPRFGYLLDLLSHVVSSEHDQRPTLFIVHLVLGDLLSHESSGSASGSGSESVISSSFRWQLLSDVGGMIEHLAQALVLASEQREHCLRAVHMVCVLVAHALWRLDYSLATHLDMASSTP